MLRRVLTSLALAAVGLPAIIFGGIFYFLVITIFLVGAAWEYVQLFRVIDSDPHEILTLSGVLAIALARVYFAEMAVPVFVVLILLAMTVHLIAFERGRNQAALDFGVTVAGIVYLGWLGSYLLDLRINLPMGGWWLMFILPMVWLGDTGAYTIGAAYGKHKMTPRLSPKKSWEGYIAGVLTAAFGGALFAYAYSAFGGPFRGWVTPWSGAMMGLVIGALTPLGDLGESMLKRQAGLKDSSNIFPGHGGFLDRIDSWIWGAVLGYYMIRLFIL